MAKRLAKKEVVIVQITCPHYRAPFFCGLRDKLQKQGINLRLLYGDSERDKTFLPGYHAKLDWAEPFEPLFLPLKSATLEPVTWHPILKRILSADLIVTEAASRYLINYLLYLIRHFGGPRLAFWGHGWNHFLDNQDSRSERIKHWLGKRADWYFAYTEEVKEGLVGRGYLPTRITNVQNASESPRLCKISSQKEAVIRKDWNIGVDDPVALYCGRMYLSKRLEFLLTATEKIRRDVPSFQLILVGGGPEEPIVREAAQQLSYIHFAGPLFGRRKDELFAISRLYVLPGRVGLSLVDAFHYGVPPVATRYPYHSPEFHYLRHGENGLISEDDTTSFAQAVVQLATDDVLYERLMLGCKKSAQKITIEDMIERFANGIVSALDMQSK